MAKDVYWEKETDMCADFMTWARKRGWVPYPECHGWDILLVRPEDGFQIGIEAKLSLNAKVLCQVLESDDCYPGGPDIHAVLVPNSHCVNGLAMIAERLNIVVIQGDIRKRDFGRIAGKLEAKGIPHFDPQLPKIENYRWENRKWPERCPDKRLDLPDYIPDTIAGDKSPVTLTDWKIRAIKIMIIIELWGSVTRSDFKALGIDYSRWTNYWLRSTGDGGWVPDERRQMPDFKAQHPVNYEQIKADWPEWSKTLPARLLSI